MLNFFAIGSILGCLVVILGAFGAHGLKDVLDDHGKSIYDKAVLYQMFHSLSIFVVALLNQYYDSVNLMTVVWLFSLGIILIK